MTNLQQLYSFIHEIEGLKKLLRHSWLSDGRQESVAEHTWRMAVMAMVLQEQLEKPIDIGRVLKMILIHDLAEIRAGDYHAFRNVPKDKHHRELTALKGIIEPLSTNLQTEFIELWEEFESRQTPEAQFASALDKLEVLIQHNEADISTWDEKEFDFNLTYGDDKVAHSETLKALRKLILNECVEKINAAR